MKLDILVFAAHPDDAELSCAGIILNQIAKGQKVGIIDLTKGELGTRGTPELRRQEAEKAKQVLGVSVRENLGLKDGFFENDEDSMYKIISSIRKYQPEVVLANALEDRHPDHGRAAELVKRAFFLAGLAKIETQQEVWRPKALYHYIQDTWLKPDVIVDISPYWEKKREAILAFGSQFHSENMNTEEPQTYISSSNFLYYIEARAREMGHAIGVAFGEGLMKSKPIGINDLRVLV